RLSFLSDHRALGAAVLPAVAYVEMALAAGHRVLGGGPLALEELVLERPLALDRPRRVQAVLVEEDAGRARVPFATAAAGGGGTRGEGGGGGGGAALGGGGAAGGGRPPRGRGARRGRALRPPRRAWPRVRAGLPRGQRRGAPERIRDLAGGVPGGGHLRAG